jgi:putative hemolysin
MKFAAAQSAGSVILALGLLLSGCSSNENPSTAPIAAPEEEETAMAALDTCQKVAAGYIVQIPDGEFDVCPMESHYAPSQGTLTKIPSATAEFGLSGFGPDFTDSAVSLNHPASGASDGTSLAIADRFNNRVLVFSSLPSLMLLLVNQISRTSPREQDLLT